MSFFVEGDKMPNKYWTSSWRGYDPNSKPGNAWFLESFFKFVDKSLC
jgi:hypothetical protein